MALTVEELKLLITANADQFHGELEKIQSSLQVLGTRTDRTSNSIGGNFFGSMVKANIVSGIVTSTVGTLTREMKEFTTSVIANGSQLARLRIANQVVTRNMGLTSDAVQQLRRDLADANTWGIAAEQVISSLALSGLVDLARGLEFVDARSGEASKGVTALVLAIKDLSAARGIESVIGIERISRFIQMGRTELVDGLIEIGEINREYAAEAARIGKTSVEQLTALERAAVRMDIVMREGSKSFGAYAATYNTSGKIFQSLRAIIRNITSEIGASLEPVLRTGSLVFLQFFRGLQSSAIEASGSIRDFANKVAGYIVALVRIIGRLGSKLPLIGAGFRNLANFTLQPIRAAGQLSNAIGGAGDTMDATGTKARRLKNDLLGLAGFDELNVLNQIKDTAGAGAGADGGGVGAIGGGGVGGGADGFLDTTEEILGYAAKAEEVFKNIGETIKGIFKPLLDNPVGRFLLDLAKKAGLAWLAFKIAKPILGILLSPLVAVFGIVGKLVGLFGALKPVLLSTVSVFGLFSAPVWLVVAAIAAVVAVFILLYKHSETFRESINQLISGAFTWIQTNLVPIFTEFIEKIKEMASVFQSKLPLIKNAIRPLVTSIEKFLVGAFELLGEVVAWVWKKVLEPLAQFLLANMVPAFSVAIDVLIVVIEVFSEVASTVLDIIIPVLNILWDVFKVVFEAVAAIVTFAWNNVIRPVFRAIHQVITGLVIPVIKNLVAVWTYVFNIVKNVAVGAWNRIWSVMRPIVNWIGDKIAPIVERMKNRVIAAFQVIKSVGSTIWGGIRSAFRTGINGVIGLLNGFIRNINRMIGNVNKVADKIPGTSPISFRIGEIPRLASGGFIKGPALAFMGEQNYDEAVLPLDRNTEWAEKVADLLREAGGDESRTGQTIIVQVGNETLAEFVIDDINDRALASGLPILKI